MRRWANVVLLLAQRRRRWSHGKPTLGHRLMFAGNRDLIIFLHCHVCFLAINYLEMFYISC